MSTLLNAPTSWDWTPQALREVADKAKLADARAKIAEAEALEQSGRLADARACWQQAHGAFQGASLEAGRKKNEEDRIKLGAAGLRCLRHSDRLYDAMRSQGARR
jgi:hypothetical protein